MAWLVRGEEVLATVEERSRGWRSRLCGAIVLDPPVLLAPSSALDVAWCRPAGAEELEVRKATTVAFWKGPVICFRSTAVVAPAGAFERWGLQRGDRLVVRGRG